MYYFICETHKEAASIIADLRLKRNMELKAFQVFTGENIRLTVSGSLADGASAVARLLTLYPSESSDKLAYISRKPVTAPYAEGDVVILNKLIEPLTQKHVYPDMLYETSIFGIKEASEDTREGVVYRAAAHFINSHNIFILRIISDSESIQPFEKIKKWLFQEQMQPRKLFSHIYIEKQALGSEITQNILKTYKNSEVIEVNHYKDVFCKKNQSFSEQTKSRKLILAVNRDRLIRPGSRFCLDFGHERFLSYAGVLNCLYNCKYCYLQGVYPSANIVIFVNIEDSISEIKKTLEEAPVFLTLSYDADLLVFEKLTGFIKKWMDFGAINPNLTLELRTKSASFGLLKDIKPIDNFILSWSLSPNEVAKEYEINCPTLSTRLKNINRAINAGFKVRLCFEPIIYTENWENIYSSFFEYVFENVPADKIKDVSIGALRFYSENYKKLKKQNLSMRSGENHPEITGLIKNIVSKWVAPSKIWVYD